MLYYRFRPYTEFSLKELMYNEMYFASTEECNDPFDSKTFYEFDNDIEKWVNFILFALEYNKPKPNLSGEQLQKITEYFCSKCPLTFDDLIENNILSDFPVKTNDEKILVDILRKLIPQIAQKYKPSPRYFVSFAKEPNEVLMWSHYANKHYGFCLIFKPIEKKIKQFEFRNRKQIRRETPKAFAQEMSYSFPIEFELHDIDYIENVVPSNAFLHMPVAVTGEVKNDEQRERIRKEQEKHYSQKGISWNYEKESRLMLSPPPAWLFGENIEFSNQERLLYYDPSHLVGIIYGAKLSVNEKKRIQQIILEKNEWSHYYIDKKKIKFNFVEFEAKLSKSQREIEIEPIAITTCYRLDKSDKDFERLYNEWKEGWGVERDNKSSRKIKVE